MEISLLTTNTIDDLAIHSHPHELLYPPEHKKAGQKIEYTSESGEIRTVIIELVGRYSDEWYNAEQELIGDKNVHARKKGALLKREAKMVSDLVVGWDEEWFKTKFTKAAVYKFMVRHDYRWIREQIAVEIAKDSNYWTDGE